MILLHFLHFEVSNLMYRNHSIDELSKQCSCLGSATTPLHLFHLEREPIFRMHLGSQKEKVTGNTWRRIFKIYINAKTAKQEKGRKIND